MLTLLFWVVLGCIFYFFYGSNRWFLFLLLAGWVAAWIFVFKKIKHRLGFIASFIFFTLLVWIIINLSPVQNFLVKKITQTLSQNLQTTVSLKHVDFSLFNKMLIKELLIKDKKQDTLLHAGTAQVNITDWFFFKDKITLKYVALKDVAVNLTRTDSVWNYQFLVDYFSGPQKNKNSKKPLQIDLKIIELENIKFNKIDNWLGQNTLMTLQQLTVEANAIDLSNKKININTIDIENTHFSQSNYAGNKPPQSNTAHLDTKNYTPQKYNWNNDDWVILVKNIQIKNSSFSTEKQTTRLPFAQQFDAKHISFYNINGSIKNLLFLKDTLTATINLSTQENCGLQIKQLQTQFKFTPQIMEFNNLSLLTNKSQLGNYYAMKYENFNSDMSDFIHSVVLDTKFSNTTLSSADIAFFAPEVKDVNRMFTITGNAKGTIDNLTAKNLIIKTGNTFVDGDIALRGLPDLPNTFINFKSRQLTTDFADLKSIIPSLKGVAPIGTLGKINFKGNFTGFTTDFVTYGNINTNLGNIVADVNMKLPKNAPPTYSGKISTTGFGLGKLINNSSLGIVVLDGNLTGSGFKADEVNANFKGNIHQLQFLGYNYKNITVDGNFTKQIFTGHGEIDDPNLQIEKFDGTASLNKKEALYNFDAILGKANFKNLNLTTEDFAMSGHFNLQFTGNTIDNFLGEAKIFNATLFHNNIQLPFDSLLLRSYILDNKKSLSLQSNEMDGTITGNFKIAELPNAFKVFLHKYYPAYITQPTTNLSNQDFNFLLKTRQVNDYVQLLNNKLSGFDNAVVSGHLKLSANELNINAQVPQMVYDKKIFNDINLVSNGNFDTLVTKITAGDIVLNDSLHFPQTDLSIKSHQDISLIQLKTHAGKTLNDAELNATVQTLSDGVKINFAPSSFIVNDKKWQLEKNGTLTINKTFVQAGQIKFVQGNQEINFYTELDDATKKTNVVVGLTKVDIDDFVPLFLKNPRIEGVLTGRITASDVFDKPKIEIATTAENFTIDNKTIGDAHINGTVNTATGLIQFKTDANNPSYQFAIDGSINYKDSTTNAIRINLLSQHFDISLLNNYLGSIFSNMQGDAVCNLKVDGSAKHQSYTGTALISNGSVVVNYTQCKYNFSPHNLIFNDGELNFGIMPLKDTLGNEGSLSGKMNYTNFFQNISFDNLKFETAKMLVLNTAEKDNSQFYGKVIGKAQMVLNGDISDMKMQIKGEPSILDSSHIYLPTGAGKEVGVIDYIDFIQFGNKMEEIKTKKGTNILVDMDLKANPACKIDVILDKATGDIIKGQGNGNLLIRVGTNDNLSIRGRYDITKGDYTFNFQTFFKKPFVVNSGSSIAWNGDPYLANINIEAEYLAKDIDLSSISSSNNFKQKGDLKIVAALTGILNKPDIKFSFVLPEKNPLYGDYFAQKKLDDFKKEPSEMNKQVASLLLINSFISANQNVLTGNTPFTLAANSIGGVVSGWLTGIFNKSLEKATKGIVSAYLNPSFDLQNTAAQLQASVKTGVQLLLNNRLVISLGGNIDFNSPYAVLANKSLISPDITIEYMLTKDGRWRAVGFNRTSIVATDLSGSQRNKTGIKLSYRKDFDKKENR